MLFVSVVSEATYCSKQTEVVATETLYSPKPKIPVFFYPFTDNFSDFLIDEFHTHKVD